MPQIRTRILLVVLLAAGLVAAGASVAVAQRESVPNVAAEDAAVPKQQASDELGAGGPATDVAPSIAAAQRIQEELGTEEPSNAPLPDAELIYINTFSTAEDANRIDNFVHYRDPFVINHTTGSSDHAPTGGINCTAPEETRPQTRENPYGHIYQCLPGGDSAKGHMMAYAMDNAGYGFVGGLPDQVFEGVDEVSVDINTTSAGGRNFIEIKVLPASETYVNAMPCGPDLPCNGGWDYDDVDGVGVSTDAQQGTGLRINTPRRPDGYRFDRYSRSTRANGDVHFANCDTNSSFCFEAAVHGENKGIRQRFKHTLRDNGDGTISFGVADDGFTNWATAPGSFPDGPVRVVIAFHSYTGTKSGNGPGFEGNLSPSTGGFTWHWDNLTVAADTATPSEEFFGGISADRIVTPDGCIAFSQGQRSTADQSDIEPQIICDDNGWS